MICNLLGIDLVLSPPRAIYQHGWGTECSQAKDIKYSWYLTVFDVNGKSTTLPFDHVQGSAPLIVGLDIEKYGNTHNMKTQTYIEFKRTNDNSSRKVFT